MGHPVTISSIWSNLWKHFLHHFSGVLHDQSLVARSRFLLSTFIFHICWSFVKNSKPKQVMWGSNILVASPLIQSSPFSDPNYSFLICCNTLCAVQLTLLAWMFKRRLTWMYSLRDEANRHSYFILIDCFVNNSKLKQVKWGSNIPVASLLITSSLPWQLDARLQIVLVAETVKSYLDPGEGSRQHWKLSSQYMCMSVMLVLIIFGAILCLQCSWHPLCDCVGDNRRGYRVWGWS